MSRRSRRRARPPVVPCLLTVAMLAGACSVTTPRGGERALRVTASRDGNGLAPEVAREDDGTLTSDGGVVPSSGGIAGGSGTGDRAASERLGTGTTVGNGTTGTTHQGDPSPGAGAVGVTADTITISAMVPMSGVYGPTWDVYKRGFETWLEDVNSNGGIHGRRVVVKMVDNRSTPEGGVAACKEVLSNASFMAISMVSLFGTDTDCLDKAGAINLYGVSSTRVAKDWRHSYGIQPHWDVVARTLPSLMRRNGDGGKKIGVLYINNGQAADGGTAVADQLEQDGMDLVGVEVGEPNQASFAPQLLRLKSAGAEVVAISAILESVTILRDARSIDFHPRFYGGTGFSLDLMTSLARDLARGAHAARGWASIDSAAYQAFEKRAAAHGRSGGLPSESFVVYGYGLVLQHVLEVAGPAPTHDSLRAGIEATKGFVTEVMPALTWGPGDYEGSDAAFPLVCCRESDWSWKTAGPSANRF